MHRPRQPNAVFSADQPEQYFTRERADAIRLIPGRVGRVLELGCGAGRTLAAIKRSGLAEWVGGIEFSPDVASNIPPEVDQVWVGDIEHMEFDIAPASVDLILCLDILEHLVDPWVVVTRLHRLLAPGGMIIASIPNIRNREILGRLLFRGEWNYQEQGILDRTHLRFFTKKTAISLMESSGLKVDHVSPANKIKWKPWLTRGLLHFLTARRLVDFYVIQYLIRARNI